MKFSEKGEAKGKSKAKKPTRDQKTLMAKNRLLAENYLVIKDTKEELVLVNKLFGKTRIIKKEPGRRKLPRFR